jgi:hypothetical protein
MTYQMNMKPDIGQVYERNGERFVVQAIKPYPRNTAFNAVHVRPVPEDPNVGDWTIREDYFAECLATGLIAQSDHFN